MPVTESSLPTHPLYWWSDTDLRRLNLCLSPVIQTWFDEWGDGACLNLQCQIQPASVWNKGKLLRQDWLAFEIGTKCFWLEASPAQDVFSMLFGNCSEQQQSHRGLDGEISHQLIGMARQALIDHLNKALLGDGLRSELEPEAFLFERWSGAVAIILTIAGIDLRLLLNADLAKELIGYARKEKSGQAATLLPLSKAIENYKVSMNVELKPVVVDLGTLASLQVGDVLSLAHNLNDPVQLKDSFGQVVGEGYFGRVGDTKALQLKK